MGDIQLINQLLDKESCDSMASFMDRLQDYYSKTTIISPQVITSDLIDIDFVDEIKNLSENISVFFGKTLRDLKCNITDDDGLREHAIFLRYRSHRNLVVTDTSLPYTSLQERDYSSIEEVVEVFRNYINNLAAYFKELESIDSQCIVKEPVQPTYKENYRKILIDSKTWLHIEVSPDGSARNIHLNRQQEQLYDKLSIGLLNWDHDKDIVQNINYIFDLNNVPENPINNQNNIHNSVENEMPACGICLCIELDDCPGMPQPLCPNPNCDVCYHKSCLFQWLVACDGGRLPTFGVANGECPTCTHQITCSER